MTIYAVQRELDEWNPVDVQELKDGNYTIEHGRIMVPVTVGDEGREVTIYLAQAKGDLTRATVEGMGEFWTIAQRGTREKVTLRPRLYPDDVALHIFSDPEEGLPALLLERHDQPPTVDGVGSKEVGGCDDHDGRIVLTQL